MKVTYHPAVQEDLRTALAYYEDAGGAHLASRFAAEFRFCIAAISARPTAFARYHKSARFRRVRVARFPYLILYAETPRGLCVMLLKHERRHPLYGLERH